MKSVGEALIGLLEVHGVEFVFGIPGVHTVELYRGLAASNIRHVTPRHEQGAGFMADGYARASGKPGVAFVITGPGVTNIITAMAQARQDSVPMLVISGVNRRSSLGLGSGLLHELPDQHAVMAGIALWSHTLLDPDDLQLVIDRAFGVMSSGRPGPVHIAIPTDVMPMRAVDRCSPASAPIRPLAAPAELDRGAELCANATSPVLLCGGGSARAKGAITALAERLDAPSVLTVNARGLIGDHPLRVPASPSLPPVRALIEHSDLVIGLGTEVGQTDYDMFDDGGMPPFKNFVQVDVCPAQIMRGPRPTIGVVSTVESFAEGLLPRLAQRSLGGLERAREARSAALASLSKKIRAEIDIIETIYRVLPDAIVVGDSTQPVYAGNLYLDVREPGSWFNAATGYGALGYAPAAAVGAALARPGRPVICLVGDGGLQFSIAELGSAADALTNVIFIVWNNEGYAEIETFMIGRGIVPEGVTPSAPDFRLIAAAYGIAAERLPTLSDLPGVLERARSIGRYLIEIHDRETSGLSLSTS